MSDASHNSGPGERKLDPAELRLRAAPPAVTRISRRAVAVLAGLGGLMVAAALIYAIDPPRLFRRAPNSEFYNTDAKPGAEGLSALPRDYTSIARPLPPKVPELGPPLPGDLGRPILHAQGIPEGPASVDADAARRQQEADQALRSRVFFQQVTHQASMPSATAASRGQPTVAPASSATPPDLELQQNMQDRKLAFLNAPADRQIYSAHRLQVPVSANELMAGTVIAGSLITGINSDLPGFVKAQVTERVFDSITGEHCLIPQGSVLVGQYDSQVAFGQRRVLLAWTRLIRPDGSSIVLDRLPASDAQGQSGLEDGVDHHWGRIAAAAAVSTVLGIGAELGSGDQDRLVSALRRGSQDTFNQAGQQIVRRNINIQPTLTLRPGLPLRVVVNKDIVLPPSSGKRSDECQG